MVPEELRRSSRVPKEVTILLVGSDVEGKVFSEETKTVVLSRHGAGIVSGYKLSAEQELILRNLETNQEVEVRVVGQLDSQPDRYTYGVGFLNQDINFWGIEFPPLTESEEQARRILLQCSSCESREMVEHSDLESDVFRINRGIVRYCKKCGSSTVWKEAADSAKKEFVPPEIQEKSEPAESPASASASEEPVPKPAPPFENRRKYPRTKVNYKACVRQPGSGDDIVSCEDMSRGGLRFKSRKRYFERATIEVAVPYSPGAATIFVPARVVYVHELDKEKRFRCGVEYLKASGDL